MNNKVEKSKNDIQQQWHICVWFFKICVDYEPCVKQSMHYPKIFPPYLSPKRFYKTQIITAACECLSCIQDVFTFFSRCWLIYNLYIYIWGFCKHVIVYVASLTLPRESPIIALSFPPTQKVDFGT